MEYVPCEHHRICGGWLRRDRHVLEPWVTCHRVREGGRCGGQFILRTHTPTQPVHPPPAVSGNSVRPVVQPAEKKRPAPNKEEARVMRPKPSSSSDNTDTNQSFEAPRMIYTDGAVFQPSLPRPSRAGYAAVQLDDQRALAAEAQVTLLRQQIATISAERDSLVNALDRALAVNIQLPDEGQDEQAEDNI